MTFIDCVMTMLNDDYDTRMFSGYCHFYQKQ